MPISNGLVTEPVFFDCTLTMQTLLAYTSAIDSSSGPYESLLPIGLCSLHALLRSRGQQATLANLTGVPAASVVGLLQRLKPAVIGLSQWTHNRHATLELAALAKQTLPQSLVLLGGGHATHQAELILQRHPYVDLIVTGEAEETFPELLAALQNGTSPHDIPGLVLRSGTDACRTADRPPLQDLDALPFPAAFLHEALNLDVRLQAEFISSSRGCPARCRFCASPAFWGKQVRFRSADSVAEEMTFLRDRFGLIYLSLRDDTFTADRRRTASLCRELIRRRIKLFWNCQSRVEAIDPETLDDMRRAGCECLQLGIESGSPRMLGLLGKRADPDRFLRAAEMVRQAGMQLSVYLIAGIPEESRQDRELTISLIRAMQPDDLQVAPLAYYPGTALFEEGVRNGRVRPDLFETERTAAVLAAPDGEKQVNRLLTATERFRRRTSARGLRALLDTTGYSAVLAMQAGDACRAAGDLRGAAAQYDSITAQEPDHPWGWLLTAELHEQLGEPDAAAECYRRVLSLVPHNAAASEALGRLEGKK